MVTHFDMFDNVITQRSESDTGLWLSGLDVLSADALRMRHEYYQAPPVICYLDRGVGAAIRRARTRMPGGGDNPVAIIKVPRERMVGSGIASSLVHEVGHQAAALLDLVESLRPVLDDLGQRSLADQEAWQLWKRWISEIVADFWSIARVGIASTLGLMGVVSLPRAFVFRVNTDDPHPTPWIRVKLSASIGNALYPQPAWGRLADLWEAYYPLKRLSPLQARLLPMLEKTIPALVAVLVNHRPHALQGSSLSDALDLRGTAAGPAARVVEPLAELAPGNVRRGAHRGLRDDRTGTSGRQAYSGRRECRGWEAAEALGSSKHVAGSGELRGTGAWTGKAVRMSILRNQIHRKEKCLCYAAS